MTAGQVLCLKCRRRWIQVGSRYYARQIGPKCGGRIRAGWRPSAPVRVAVDVADGQLELDLAGAAG